MASFIGKDKRERLAAQMRENAAKKAASPAPREPMAEDPTTLVTPAVGNKPKGPTHTITAKQLLCYALCYAADSGDTKKMEKALSDGADIDFPAVWGMTPLGAALAARNVASVAFLLSKGADPDAQTCVNNVPLGDVRRINMTIIGGIPGKPLPQVLEELRWNTQDASLQQIADLLRGAGATE